MGKSNRLTAKQVALAKPGIHRDGNGLLLRVEANGSGRWVLRIAVNTRRRDIGLGSARDVSLRDARDLAHELRRAARLGQDPLGKRRADRHGAITFEAAADLVHKQRQHNWGNKKHQDQWLSSLRAYAFPILGNVPVGEVQVADVLKVLSPIWLRKPETARRVRQRIETVLTWAVAAQHRSPSLVNAAQAACPALPKQPRRHKHHPAVKWEAIPKFVIAVRNSDSGDAVRLALEFLVLAAARTSEVLGAQWHEIDFDARTWAVPATRMKSKREHRVPLSNRALELLLEARVRWPRSRYLFPGRSGNEPLSNMALLMAMRRLGYVEVPHGLRSSFRDWAADNRKDRDLAEAALAHACGNKTEAAYLRTDLFDGRRMLMDEWGAFVDGHSHAG